MTNTDLSSISEEIHTLISENRLEEAFKQLTNQPLNSSQKRTLILIKSRYDRLQKKGMKGILSEPELNLEQNRIGDSLLSFVDGNYITSFIPNSWQEIRPVHWAIGIGTLLILSFFLYRMTIKPDVKNTTHGSGSPILNDVKGDVNYNQYTEPSRPVKVPENLRQFVQDSTQTDTSP